MTQRIYKSHRFASRDTQVNPAFRSARPNFGRAVLLWSYSKMFPPLQLKKARPQQNSATRYPARGDRMAGTWRRYFRNAPIDLQVSGEKSAFQNFVRHVCSRDS